ncbi:MAG: hypothetical protein WA584_16480 [Pyrinomonadaceae bacterium]
MNQEITLDDYKSIGTMETALSKHADEAFFELSGDKQKIAEKIFKCLTETDRENREIRRATTIEKLCAISDADFEEVASVIDVFRKEGRTFLMPPPGVELNENSLIDISHESLIRKWERLKNWVEEEGQSSRTYRRLAEDALLNQQNRMGFWSDPELKDALEWRENFKPNETWAQLYKETGERQFKASFADAMQYLDESEINRDEEIAEDTRQRETLRKSARNLRWMLAGLGVFSILTIGAAIFAFYQMNKSIRATNALEAEKTTKDKLNLRLMDEINFSEIARKDKEKAFDELNVKTNELESKKEELSVSLDKQEEATEKAEREKERAQTEKKRADNEAQQAKLSEAEKEEALERQKQLKDEADIAKEDAIKKREEAELALKRLASTKYREELNRTGLVLLEQGEFNQALKKFDDLLKSYENQNELMSIETRTDGRWWASHNLGIINSKLDKFNEAEKFYKYALKILGESPETVQSQDSGQYFRLVSYQTGDEINRNKVTTLRRLAQLYRARAENVATDKEWEELLLQAIGRYNQLLLILDKEPRDAKQPNYPADVYVELADCLADLYDSTDYEKAKYYYNEAVKVYGRQSDFAKQVAALKKWADAAVIQHEYEAAAKLLIQALNIQENRMNLSPLNPEIADSYDRLAKAYVPADWNKYKKSPPYAELFDLIRDLNYAANKTDKLAYETIKNLANTYIQAGRCRRAGGVYFYAINNTNSKTIDNTLLDNPYSEMVFFGELADLYQNKLRDDEKALEYFDKFAAMVEKPDFKIPFIIFDSSEELFLKAGDFYLARGNFERAEKIYKQALQNDTAKLNKVENSRLAVENLLGKLKIPISDDIIKIARLYEAQNKPQEAEAKYMEAVNFAVSKLGESDFHTARILIYQADFYESRKDAKKAQEIYLKAKTILANHDSALRIKNQQFSDNSLLTTTALQAQIYKKLGDINRNDARIAAKYYREANDALSQYDDEFFSLKNKPGVKDYSRYSENGEYSAGYYNDKLEILEALVRLNAVEINQEIKLEISSTKAKIEDLKEKSPCQQD